jgi:hypothetical protein
MAGDDFLEPDVPEDGDERTLAARDVDEELPDRDSEGEEGTLAQEHIGLTPPD